MEPQNNSMLECHHRMTWCSIRVLRLVSRITSSNLAQWERTLSLEANSQWVSAWSTDKIKITASNREIGILIPLLRAFFWEQQVDEEIDETLIANAVHEPEEYEFVIWWIVTMLCHERVDAWRNAKGHLEGLIKTWTGNHSATLSDLGIVQRLERVVVYILEHQQGSDLLVTGNYDKDEALWIFAESARQKYSSATPRALVDQHAMELD